MSLSVVATPIGHPDDITVRAMRALSEADVVIGEERREVARLLKGLSLQKPIELLNEHSGPEDYRFLAELCASKNVALVSDCGTPGFCDPGAELVAQCRNRGVAVTALPGASSLMTLISASGYRLSQFVFVGFLPAKTELREPALKRLASETRPCVVMDTPYRLSKLMNELASTMGDRRALLGLDLTCATEQFLDGKLGELAPRIEGQKREFMLLIHERSPIRG